MAESEFELELDELESAEEFLEYFGIPYEPSVVQVNRLHILQRFHDYIDDIQVMPEEEQARHDLYAGLLNGAYHDFVESDAMTERVFKVFRMHAPISVEIPLGELTGEVAVGAPEV